jgi:hypothetical protein
VYKVRLLSSIASVGGRRHACKGALTHASMRAVDGSEAQHSTAQHSRCDASN